MILGVVQARMGYIRLSGKVLRRILGELMLWHLIERLQRGGTHVIELLKRKPHLAEIDSKYVGLDTCKRARIKNN